LSSTTSAIQRYAICTEEKTVLIVEATSVDEALRRAQQVMHKVEPMVAGSQKLTVRAMLANEPARVAFFRDGYSRVSETRH